MNWKCQPPWFSDIIHPEEKEAELALQQNTYYKILTQNCGDIIAKAISIPKMLLTAYPVTAESSPRIYKCYKLALERLGCNQVYPLYVDFEYELKGSVFGSKENGYSILINSACGEILTDNELTAFLGGEIGHVLANHAQNHAVLDNLQIITKRIPFGGEIVRNTVLGLFSKWLIASEYTADRAALIACESIDDLISLRKKQMGLSDISTELLLNQKQMQIDCNPGMYYVLKAKTLPIIGGVNRIQEICRWVKTKYFENEFIPLFYKLCINSKEIKFSGDNHMLQLHREAYDGDMNSVNLLAQSYLFGKNGLKQSTFTGESMLREASFMGNGEAMFLEGGCFEVGLLDDIKRPELAQVLYRAAASRGEKRALLKLNQSLSKKVPESVIKAGKDIVSEANPEFWLALTKQQPNKENLMKGLNAFWAPLDDAVIAYDLDISTSGVTGLIISASGIYGSIVPNGIPFYYSWEKFEKFELAQKVRDEVPYIFLDKNPIYRCKSYNKGSMINMLIRIKRNME